jgi:hypothetical protein
VTLEVGRSQLARCSVAVGVVVHPERLVLRGAAGPLRDVVRQIALLDRVLGLLALLVLLASELSALSPSPDCSSVLTGPPCGNSPPSGRAVRGTALVPRRGATFKRGGARRADAAPSSAIRVAPHGVAQPKRRINMAEPVPAGSDVSAGTYKCTNCGYELDVDSTQHLPPCPSCVNAEWQTLSGGDSVHDPYPDRAG